MSLIRTEHSAFKYLPVAASEQAWGLRVTGSGSAHVPPHALYPPRVHPEGYMFDWEKGRVLSEFQALYITEGCGTFESKRTGQVHVEGGTMLLLFPGEWHRYMPEEEIGWTEYWIAFNGPQPQRMVDLEVLSVEEPVIYLGHQEVIIRLYREMLDLIDSEKLGFREILASLTYQVLARANAVVKQRQFGTKRVADIIQHAQVYLVENLQEPVNFEDLAEHLGVSYSWFRQHFRNYTDLPPGQYLIQLRINRAKRLLAETSFSMQQIADSCGFQSQYYFSRVFRNKVGMTPTGWRKYSRGELETEK